MFSGEALLSGRQRPHVCRRKKTSPCPYPCPLFRRVQEPNPSTRNLLAHEKGIKTDVRFRGRTVAHPHWFFLWKPGAQPDPLHLSTDPITVSYFRRKEQGRGPRPSTHPCTSWDWPLMNSILGVGLLVRPDGRLGAPAPGGSRFHGRAFSSPCRKLFRPLEFRLPAWMTRAASHIQRLLWELFMVDSGDHRAPCLGPFILGSSLRGQKGDPIMGFLSFFTLQHRSRAAPGRFGLFSRVL